MTKRTLATVVVRGATFIVALLCAACASGRAGSTARATSHTDPARVLILGDSISIGYTPLVRELLRDEAVVQRPAGNCAGTTHGVQHVDEWLAIDGGRWDLIWFNFGLHDLKHVDAETGAGSNDPAAPRQAEAPVYERQLRRIVAALRATGAKLVFATTTPVPPGRVRPHRDVEDAPRYNEIARRVMAENDVAVHDLYSFALERQQAIQQRANVHFTPAGYAELARSVAERVRTELANR